MRPEFDTGLRVMARLSAVMTVRPALGHSAGGGSSAESGVKGGDEVLLLVSV